MDTGFSPSVIACFTAISIPLSLSEAVLLLLTTLTLFLKKWDFHVGLTLGVFTRCYSHHHGYFLFLHLIICLNSVGDRDGEMGYLAFSSFVCGGIEALLLFVSQSIKESIKESNNVQAAFLFSQVILFPPFLSFRLSFHLSFPFKNKMNWISTNHETKTQMKNKESK